MNIIGVMVVIGVILIGLLGILIAVIFMCDKKMGKQKSNKGKRRNPGNDRGCEYADNGRENRLPEDGGSTEYDENTDDRECPDYDRNLNVDECLDYDRSLNADECLDYDRNLNADECLDYDRNLNLDGYPDYDKEPNADESFHYDRGQNVDESLVYGEEPCADENVMDREESNTEKNLVYDGELDAEESFNYAEESVSDTASVETAEPPVIKVDNVTMKFRVATGSTSGLKDFLIQKMKKQITTRDLLALDGVSFDVYKGEIVGIIGTNGSGKSTLLKIVSGALKPTSGKVVVDQSKIQLLTLGAGFDTELSARENVYLNGAIIGYSREFIDEHYDEIVEFAELEGFMDEKVKNFSSGMVSRLGFAIATAGDAAEILILDEVLSVGDEFFRMKSLARVKEMIHGGSTVLMVSHGMGTILSNCTKAVWIEKGRLQMAGDTKTVCEAYRKQFG